MSTRNRALKVARAIEMRNDGFATKAQLKAAVNTLRAAAHGSPDSLTGQTLMEVAAELQKRMS